ncbi:MAG: hypothetical protein AB9879_05140 [Methanothrix sp.]
MSRIFDLARFSLSCLRRNPVERGSPGGAGRGLARWQLRGPGVDFCQESGRA